MVLMLFVQICTTSDEDGGIDQSYLFLLKNKSLWDLSVSISRKNDKQSNIPLIGNMEFANAGHSYRPFSLFFLLRSSKITPVHRLCSA